MSELYFATKYGSEDVEYIFSHDLNKIKKGKIYMNSRFKINRWFFHFRYFFWKQIILPIKLYLSKVDYLICPDYVAPIFCYSNKITVIHDDLFWKYPNDYSRLWRKFFITMVKLGIDSRTNIVTTSLYSKKNLLKILKTENIHSIYQSSDKYLNPRSQKRNCKYIFHLGSFEKRKNLITLVKAFKLLKNSLDNKYKLVLAGKSIVNGNNSVLKEIKRFIQKNDLNNSIEITGYLDESKVDYFFSNSVMYIFPSNDEGFGIPIIEAMQFSLPIICSDIEIFREIGQNAVLYFKKNSYVSLYNQMKILIENKELKLSLIKKGKSRVKNFNRKKFISEFEKLY